MTTLKDLQRKLNEADNAVEARLLSDAATIRKLTKQRDGLLEACKKASTCASLPDCVKDIIRDAIAATK